MKIKLIGVLAVLVFVVSLAAGCGNKVAGVYTSLGQTLALSNNGSVTYEVRGSEIDHGSFSCNGKEVRIKFAGEKFVYTFKVAENTLIDRDSGNTWHKK